MTEREIDRTGWPSGPWDDEPDSETWVDETTEFPCRILRTDLGHLCGYAGVPRLHPYFGADYNCDDILWRLDAHGGITFSGSFADLPYYWFFGFDCAHSGDLVPRMVMLESRWGNAEPRDEFFASSYRNWGEVQAETRRLAAQLRKMFGPLAELAMTGEEE
jgi:hypothetical protein